MENIVKGESVSSQEGVVSVDIGGHQTSDVSDLMDNKANVFIRPEGIILSKAELKSNTRNSIFEKITGIAQIDATFRAYMDNGLSASMTKQAIEELGLSDGENVYAQFKATDVHLFRR